MGSNNHSDMRNTDNIEEDGAGLAGSRRRGDGGVYLVVADRTPESLLAMRYAARRTEARRGHLGIVHVTASGDFQHWGKVEARVREEVRSEAEKFLWSVAKQANDLAGQMPVLYLKENAEVAEAVLEVINQDPRVVMLILGGGVQGSGPGPLVSYFVSRGLTRLRVPITIVPGHLDARQIDELVL